MTDKPQITEVDVTAGTTFTRDMTDEEIADMEARAAAWEEENAARIAAEEAKAEALASAQTKLAKLGLTADEVAALVG